MHTNRKRALAAVAAALAIVAALGAYLSSLGSTTTPDRAAGNSRESSGSSPPVQRSPAFPAVDFSGVSWPSYHGVRLPVSAQAGPHDTAGGVASGFTDTPLGALLAAVNIGVRTSWELGPGVFQPTIQQQVTGPFEAAMLAADLDDWGAGGAQGAGGTGPDAVEAAYQWVGYTPSSATVDVVTEGTAGNGATVFAVTQIQVEWVAEDWRVVAPPGGDWGNDSAQVASPNGYLPFPGQEG